MSELAFDRSKPLYSSSQDSEDGQKYQSEIMPNRPSAHMLERYFLEQEVPTEKSRNQIYNPAKPRSSNLLNKDDSMAMHLLVETALYDSNEFEVLSYEEVDSLKKEYTSLINRIDASKRKLVLETKVRDAAQSLSRLSSKKGRSRGSLMGGHSMNSHSDITKQDHELTECNRKCEELSQQIWKLDNRITDIQNRLLQHNAGILGMIHRGNAGLKSPLESPDSSYALFNESTTHIKSRSDFDERSLYFTADKLRLFGNKRKSPNLHHGSSQIALDQSMINKRLDGLNSKLGELILKSSLESQFFSPLKSPGSDAEEQLTLLEQQVQHLLSYLQRKPDNNEPNQDTAETRKIQAILFHLWDKILSNEDRDVNGNMANGRTFSLSAFSSNMERILTEWAHLRTQKPIIDETSKPGPQYTEDDSTTKHLEDELSQVELKNSADGLLMTMSRLHNNRSNKRENDGENQSGAESIEAQLLEARYLAQIQERGKEITELRDRCEDIERDRDILNAEIQALKSEMNDRVAELQGVIDTLTVSKQSSDQATKSSAQQQETLLQQTTEKDKQIARMDQEITELSGKVAQLSTEVVMAKAELDASYGSKQQRAAATAEARAAAAALEAAHKQPQSVDTTLLQEIEDLAQKNQELIDEIVALKNERANAANDEHLDKRCKDLQAELDGMLKDFENLTKQSIENEQERNRLEQIIDSLKDKNESLEVALGEEKIKGLGARSSVGSNGRHGGESTSITVLKQEFKKMMREMKADSARALKSEQEERKKLEAIIRNKNQQLKP